MLEAAFKDVTHYEKKAPLWVFNDFVPVGLTFMAGPPKKAYKSTITIIEACLAARWATSALPPWMFCHLGGPTMVFSYEAGGGEILWVIEDGLQVTPQEGFLSIADDPWMFQLDQPASGNALLEYLNLREPRLVIMDPFRNMWSGDENDSAAIIKVLGPLRMWAHTHEASIIVVHHINKPPTAKDASQPGGMYTMRGSGAIPGLADGIIVIEPTNQEGQVRIHTTFKRGTSWARTIALGVPGYGWPSAGYEVLPDMTMAIEEDWTSYHGVHDLDWAVSVCAARKVIMPGLKESLEGLLRNQIIQPTPVEVKHLGLGIPL